MSPRLLSLLSMIEVALDGRIPAGSVTRSADYRKGVARMSFGGGSGGIVLQNFLMADSQLCVRVELRGEGAAAPVETAIYPQTAGFDWSEAVQRIAQRWLALVPAAAAAPDVDVRASVVA